MPSVVSLRDSASRLFICEPPGCIAPSASLRIFPEFRPIAIPFPESFYVEIPVLHIAPSAP